jgi:hypothetical protein
VDLASKVRKGFRDDSDNETMLSSVSERSFHGVGRKREVVVSTRPVSPDDGESTVRADRAAGGNDAETEPGHEGEEEAAESGAQATEPPAARDNDTPMDFPV